jgi:glutamyl-tRNA synthetase
MFAKATNGTFILRIEDTDAERSTDASAAEIVRDLTTLGLSWDEGPGVGGDYGPYFQSRRADGHRAIAEELLRSGAAYRSFQSAEELAATRAARERGESASPRARYQTLPPEEERERLARGDRYAIVLRVPPGETRWVDLVRGEMKFDNAELGDFVLMKSDGTASYNFAVSLDDSDMRVTHVLRGEDHISNTPKQLVLLDALERARPEFGHVPLIVGPDKARLSKRHGATSVQHFLDQGLLPDAVANYLAMLGWSAPGGEEIFRIADVAEQFSLERVGKTAASFDPVKLEWVNGQHLVRMDPATRGALVGQLLAARGVTEFGRAVTPARAVELSELVGDRMKTIPQFLDYAGFLFDDVEPDAADAEKALKKSRTSDVRAVADRLESLEPFDAATIEAAYRAFVETTDGKLGNLVAPCRLAITGKRVSPGLFESIAALGRERSVGRLRAFADRFAPVD